MEGRCELFCLAVGEHEQAGSVEDEFVVCPYLVEVEDGGLELGGGGGEGREPALEFAAGEGACGEVDEEVGGLGVVDWVAPVAGLERWVVAGPEVFADGEDEPAAAEGDVGESLSWQEVSGLIEDIVGGEEEFVVPGDDASVLDEDRRILELVRSGRVAEREADEERRTTYSSARECDERLVDSLVESGSVEEVTRRVACECEFRGDHKVGSAGACEVERSEDARGVFGEVSDPRVELRCEDLQG